MTEQTRTNPYGFHIDRSPSDIMEEYGILGEDYARKKARFQHLDDMEKTILAGIKNEIAHAMRGGDKDPPETKVTRMALADERYVKFLKELYVAQEEALLAEVAFKQEDKRIELLRSLETSARSQVERFG